MYFFIFLLERVVGLEPTTFSLATKCSTSELHLQFPYNYTLWELPTYGVEPSSNTPVLYPSKA